MPFPLKFKGFFLKNPKIARRLHADFRRFGHSSHSEKSVFSKNISQNIGYFAQGSVVFDRI
jgi:hypothetical protein